MNKFKSEKQFGLIFLFVLLVLLFFDYTKENKINFFIILIICLLLAFIFLFPNLLYWPNKIWIKLGIFLGRFTSPIMLFIMFYFIFLPIGIIYKCFGNDPLKRKLDKNIISYWETRKAKRQSMKRQF